MLIAWSLSSTLTSSLNMSTFVRRWIRLSFHIFHYLLYKRPTSHRSANKNVFRFDFTPSTSTSIVPKRSDCMLEQLCSLPVMETEIFSQLSELCIALKIFQWYQDKMEDWFPLQNIHECRSVLELTEKKFYENIYF